MELRTNETREQTEFKGKGRNSDSRGKTDTNAGVSCWSFRIGVDKQSRIVGEFDFVE